MRPLTDDELRTLFDKLQIYISPESLKILIDRPDAPHTFRLIKDRVYYLAEKAMRFATNIGRDQLMSIGTCFGKFSKAGKFRLHVTCLDYLAQYAKYKVWVKPGAEMSFLYGNNVTKAGLARITDGTPQYGGVIVYSLSDIPLGFGIAAQPTEYCKDLEPGSNVVLHQGDIGEYLRVEDGLF
jgi:60S ribosome subunit biogenesis protein NIP7